MRITLLAVGKARAGPERDLFDSYAERLDWKLTLREVEARRANAPVAERKAEEAALLLAALPDGATLIALDETGELLSSETFARRLSAWRDQGLRDLAVAIGGADGLDESVRRRAALVLSFGRMTFPHLLMRPLIAEQLYRARSILQGHPYHRA